MRDTLLPMLHVWYRQQAAHPHATAEAAAAVRGRGLQLADWLTGARMAAAECGDAAACWLELTPSRLLVRARRKAQDRLVVERLRIDKLLRAWITALLASASGQPLRRHAGRPRCQRAHQADRPRAAARHARRCCSTSGTTAWPRRCRCRSRPHWRSLPGRASRPTSTTAASAGSRGEVDDDPCLARMFPDFESLAADGRVRRAGGARLPPAVRLGRRTVSGVEPHPEAGLGLASNLAIDEVAE